ncbi:MAG: AFG1 family ATPase [Betaproteobacteria bacterium]|nr:MAG: AFG1 family ATPase [Betaproteobacteria bacterium]
MLPTLQKLCNERGITLDPAQQRAAERLARLNDELTAFKNKRASLIGRVFSKPAVPQSVYFFGGVGRGKSLLMDTFYSASKIRRKTRIHFHAFMRSVHEELRTLKHEADPLVAVAERLAERYRLICFDEFHVSDIADAMILGRLLANCFEHGIVFVMTSNYQPDRLYPDGLQRQNFMPSIALIKDKMDIVEVDSGVDYRRRTLEQDSVYHWPLGTDADSKLSATFNRLATKALAEKSITLYGREISLRKHADGVIWFDFSALCETPRSQNDYLELAQAHHSMILSNVPMLGSKESNVIRRFTLLVDVLYDHRVKLIMSAAAPLAEISRVDDSVTDGDTRRVLSEFARTTSRLTEMQSAEYMSEAHLPSLVR